MRYKLACADFTFPLLPHRNVLDLIATLEFDGVDVGLFEGRSHLWPSKELRRPVQSGCVLGRAMESRGLKAADVFLQMDPDFRAYAINHPQRARRSRARDWFVKTLEYAAVCGARHVTTLPGVAFASEPRTASWKRSCDELSWRVEEARKYRIIFGVEAHVGSIAIAPADAIRLVEQVPGLTLTLDYTHFTHAGLPDRSIEPLIAHASHFHARGARKGRLQVAVKDNVIDYQRVLRAMNKSAYRGYIGIEYVWIDWEHCNECDNLSETILLKNLIQSFM